jgi:cysteinyl-tRNA synthetase
MKPTRALFVYVAVLLALLGCDSDFGDDFSESEGGEWGGAAAPESEPLALDRRAMLMEAQTWMYQIQDLDRSGAIDALARSDYPLLVLEPTRTVAGVEDFDTRGMLAALRWRPDGEPRLLLAYVDVGEAEDYRTYWEEDWQPPTWFGPGNPDFIITVDPDGWSGDYPVAYWDPGWQEIWLGDDGLIAGLARDGFDGVYLDWIEAYDDDTVRAAAEEQDVDPGMEMLWFIEGIREAGQSVIPDFIVVAQNAPYLLDEDPDFYAEIVDALAMEDTWFMGEGDAEWNDPAGGDIPNDYTDDWSTGSLLEQYQEYLARDIPVFTVDYCLDVDNADFVYDEARRHGLRPLVTRVALSRLTETPPE